MPEKKIPDVQLRQAKSLMYSLGIYPMQGSGILKKLYDTYFWGGMLYLQLFEISQAIRLYHCILEHAWEELLVNLGVVFSYELSIFKVYRLHAPRIQGLVKQIQSKEREILGGNDEAIKAIYRSHAKLAHRSGFTYVTAGTICISFYFVNPLLYNFIFPQPEMDMTNSTEPRHKLLVFSSYLPFDSDKYYLPAYLLHFAAGMYGYSYTVFSDTVLFTIFIYCIGQLKILQHYLINIHEYTLKYKEESEVEITKEEAEIGFQNKCINYHQNIIEFVDNIDKTLSTFMLFEFMTASLKISVLLIQILQNPQLGFAVFPVTSYVVLMILELYYFYWNANEIIYESTEGLAEALFYGKWYELCNHAKKNMIMMFLKAKTPCKVSIGPFYVMCLQAAVSIIRACYYYVCLILQQSN